MNIGTEHPFRQLRDWHSSCGGNFNQAAMMNKLNFKGHWNGITGKLKQRLANFTRDQQQRIRAQVQQLLGHIENHPGQMDESAERALHASVAAGDSH
jgi:uncharacterized protein YjbJ (UPF0337 family)